MSGFLINSSGPVMPNGHINLGQEGAWWRQAIAWTNIDLSSLNSCGNLIGNA